MSTPSGSDIPPGEDFGTSLEQFRQALTTEAGRQDLGIDISDEEATAIAADEELAASWYKVWRRSVRGQPSATARHTSPTVSRFARTQRDDWQRHLPVRFNPPPGWSMPSQDWILQHIGLEMSDVWRPPGAPTYDPPGWMWWVPQEPAWTAWIEQHSRVSVWVRRWAVACGVCVGLAVILAFAGLAVGAILASICTIFSSVSLTFAIASLRHFRKDPMGELRDNHTYVAERLNEAGTLRPGQYVDFTDLSDLAGLFDGE